VSDRRLGYRQFIAIGLRGCTGGLAQAIPDAGIGGVTHEDAAHFLDGIRI
jgi:hypothetical protein